MDSHRKGKMGKWIRTSGEGEMGKWERSPVGKERWVSGNGFPPSAKRKRD